MKKIKQLLIIALCLVMTVTTVPVPGDDVAAPCDHFIENPGDN